MKKKWITACLLFGFAFVAAACGSKETKVTLGEYKGLALSREKVQVTDEEVNEAIDEVRQSRSEMVEVTDRPLAMGDTVSMNFIGRTLDGVAFDGGTAENINRKLGDPMVKYIDGFDEGLVGAMPGEERELELTFPDPYTNNPDLAGVDVIFSVTVHSFREEILPELTDEFVTEVSDGKYTTVDAYKTFAREYLAEQEESRINMEMLEKAWDQVVADTIIEGELPKELYEDYYNKNYENAKTYAGYFNMELKDFLPAYMGMDEEAFEKQAVQNARAAATDTVIAREIAKAEGIEITDADIDDMAEKMALSYGSESADDFKNNTDMETFKNLVLLEKVKQFVLDHATISE